MSESFLLKYKVRKVYFVIFSCRITVPQSEGGGGGGGGGGGDPYSASSESVVLTVTGTRENVRVAQYLMQKVLKGK